MNDSHPIETAIAALEAQRATLGDAAVDAGIQAMRQKLSALAQRPDAETQQLRQVSVLFMDVVGSTLLAQNLDPEDVHVVLNGVLVRASAIVERHRGKVLQYAGDGLLAVFGAEVTAEDDAERAVQAGLALVDEGRRSGLLVARQFGRTGLDVRVGVHTGPVLLGGGVDEDGSVRGAAVHIAARMEQTAPAGALRVSQETHSLIRGRFDVEVQAPIVVKGVAEALTTYLVRRARPLGFHTRTRGIEGLQTSMVGRAAELGALQSEIEAVRHSGAARVITVVGEAGLGKSRLLHEFDDWNVRQPGAGAIFRGRAHPQSQAQAYALLREVLLERFAIDAGADPALARHAFEVGVTSAFATELGADLAQGHAHVLGHLIGLDFRTSPHVAGIVEDRVQMRTRGFHVAAQLVRRSTAAGLAMLLLDDLHWADDASLAWIDGLVQACRDVPLAVVVAARPALFERHPAWLASVPRHTRLALEPLSGARSEELADALLRQLPDAPQALRELLIRGAAGNPFYMEELLEMLIDEGTIDTSGQTWRLRARQLNDMRVPATLTGVLQARLDSLDAQGKRALQLAALVGPVFWTEALSAIDATAVRALPTLLERDLISEQVPSAFEDSRQFAFRHHLLHQVTYDTVLKATRREGHASVAAWLCGLERERAEPYLASIADHFEKAGDRRNAGEYHTRAAEFAATRFAHETVFATTARAMTLADADDLELRWRLHALLEREYDLRGERDTQADAIRVLDELGEALGDDARRAEVALRRTYLAFRTAQYPQAKNFAARALELAQRVDAQPLMLRARHLQAIILYCQGDLEPARTIARAGLEAAQALGERRLELRFINALAVIAARATDLVAGYFHDVQALQLCRDLGNRGDEAVCRSNLGNTMLGFGDFEGARDHLEEGLRLARAVGVRFVEPHVLRHLGQLERQCGKAAEGRDLAQQACAFSLEMKDKISESSSVLCLAQAEEALGHAEAAEAAFRQAQSLCAELEHPLLLDATAGLARLALARGDVQQATAHTETLLAHFAKHGSFDGSESPQHVHLTCYDVLRRVADRRAAAVLADAYRDLQAQASLISDSRLRECFLTRIPENRDIAQAWHLANPNAPLASAAA